GFWFVLVVAAYLFLWMITGELNTITESVLALIGIGAGTALSASLIDTGQKTTAVTAQTELLAERKALTAEIGRLTTLADTPETEAQPAARQARLAEVQGLLARDQTVERRAKGHFLSDVLSDGMGVSLHRFQMFVWTIVLGIIFCSSVYKRLAM